MVLQRRGAVLIRLGDGYPFLEQTPDHGTGPNRTTNGEARALAGVGRTTAGRLPVMKG